MSEKFSLKWIDYHSNWKKSLSELRTDSDLADVTLISEDKVKFSAHKVLLSSCSNMFKFILKGSSNANPLLFLGGVSSINLGFILDYVYHGEVNLFQEQLASFFESAQKLEVEGLLDGNDDYDPEGKDDSTFDVKNAKIHQDPAKDKQILNIEKSSTPRRQQPRAPTGQYITDISTTKFDVSSMTAEEIEKKTEELIEKKDGGWSCLACDYSTPFKNSTMKRHIQTHFEGLSYTCTLCAKEFKSKNSLTSHKSIYHNTQNACLLHLNRNHRHDEV